MPFPFNQTPNIAFNNAFAQTPQQLVPNAPTNGALDLGDIQGDVLIGLQKNAQLLVFFTIIDVIAFKTALRGVILPLITSCEEAHRREGELRERKVAATTAPDVGNDWRAVVPMSGLNIAFTAKGLNLLVPGENTGAVAPALGRSAHDIAALCGDPIDGTQRPSSWDLAFPHDAIDGVLNLAGSSREEVDSTWARLKARLRGVINDGWPNGAVGDVRKGDARGYEHFGWRDGVSQPAVSGLAEPYPGQATVDPHVFVLGAQGGPQLPANLAWMSNGSYMVFRKLEQNVAAFENFVVTEAERHGMDADLLAARMIGRWKSGAPLALAPLADDAELGRRPDRNNDFDYSRDPFQRRCPYGAHIRKTNPRADFNVGDSRIMRQGISYGRELSEDPNGTRGLLFVCYQADIANQFEKQQHDWANTPGFVGGKSRPIGRAGMVTPGLDPIIGQPLAATPVGVPVQPMYQNLVPQPLGAPPVPMDEPMPNYPIGSVQSELSTAPAQQYVTARATLYLFVPSISAIATKLGI